jgi:hypothetical protein
MKPVWDVVRETVERTAEKWKEPDYKDLLPTKALQRIDRQIQTVINSLSAF